MLLASVTEEYGPAGSSECNPTPHRRVPWKGKVTGAKPRSDPNTSGRSGPNSRSKAALGTSPCSIWRSTASSVAVTSSRSKVEDIAASGYTADRATVRQKKTGRPVRFELTEQTRQAVDDYLKVANKRPGEFLLTGRGGTERSMTTRHYACLVSEWIGSVGLDPRLFGTHSLRRTKATSIYRRTGNLRAVQLLLGTATYCPRTSD